MTQRGGDARCASIVECYHTAVAQGQLNLALALLACDFASYRAVDLVGEPVFASHSLELEHGFDVFVKIGSSGFHWFELVGCSDIGHDRLGRTAEHVAHGEVDGAFAIGLLKDESVVARGLTHEIEGCTLTLGNLLDEFHIFVVHHHAHAFLRLVANDFLGREGGVAHGQGCHIDFSTGLLDEFAQGIEVPASAVVVDRDDGVGLVFGKRADDIGHTLLHFGVGTLHGVEFDGACILAGVDAAHCATAHADAVVVATHHYYFFTSLRSALDGVALVGKAHTACEHDDLVVGKLLLALLVLEGEH